MRKICIICPYEYPIPAIKGGAIEQIVEELCQVNEAEKELDITVLTIKDDVAEKFYDNYKYTKFVSFPTSKIDGLWYFIFRVIKKVFHKYIPFYPRIISMGKWIEEHKAEYDYFIYEDGAPYAIPFLFKNIDKDKVISHLHWVGDPSKKTTKFISKQFVVSDYVSKLWKQSEGAETVDVRVLRNGIILSKFHKKMTDLEKVELREKLGISKNDKVVLYMGRIVQIKGVEELIRAIELLDNTNIVLLIVGGAKFAKQTQTTYEKNVDLLIENAKHKIIRTGFVRNDELYKYQNISDVAVMPTLCEEAAGLVAVENMAAGLPLVVTNSGGLPEYADSSCSIVVDKENNLIENLADAIGKIISDDLLRENMSKEAVEAAKNFTIEDTYRKFVMLLNE